MECPFIFKRADCSPQRCKSLEAARKQVGAIYMIGPDNEEHFVALFPGVNIQKQ